MIKSEIVVYEENKNKYPYIGKYKSEKLIILFSAEKTGVVISNQSTFRFPWNIGEFRKDWSEQDFEVFNGIVTLSNS